MIENLLRVRTHRTVLLLTLALVALCTVAPVGSAMAIMHFMPWVPAPIYWGFLGAAIAIPLIIAPPVAYVLLTMLRLLTMTIDRVDAYVRFDALTGLLTRTCLLGEVRERLAGGGAFLMVDADHFKAINDTHGHDAGDAALKALAEACRRAVPAEALVGRLGGEEFGVFLPKAGAPEASAVAEALCAAVRRHCATVSGIALDMTVSIGGAVHERADTLERTMKRADLALYRAKRAGRDCVRFAEAAEAPPMPALLREASLAG